LLLLPAHHTSRRQSTLRLLLRNIRRARQMRLLRFRLITFGLYEPSALYGRRMFAHPSWQVNPRVAWLLARRMSSYSHWLAEMETLAERGAAGWWDERAGSEGAARLRAWMDAENAEA